MQTPLVDNGFRLDPQEMKDILKSKANCLQVGFSTEDIIIKTLDDIRRHYILAVGLPNYISQMLGILGQVPARNCTFYREDGAQLNLKLHGNTRQSLYQYIINHFQQHHLPFRVEISATFGRDSTVVCYL